MYTENSDYKYPGYFLAKYTDLCCGDLFSFEGSECTYSYMGVYTHERIDYFIYKNGSIPFICKCDDLKDKVILIIK